MSSLIASAVEAAEATAEHSEHSANLSWMFGGLALAILLLALFAVSRFNVNR